MTEKHGHKHHGKSSRNILSAGDVLEAVELKEGTKFLDAGCGDGYISIEASKIVGVDGEIVAMDVYPESIEIVKNEIIDKDIKNIEAVVADITENIPLDDNKVDTILMANVLHGFVVGGEVEFVMKNIVRVLKSGGVFAVVEFRKLDSEVGPPFNVRLTPLEVSDILKEYGFNIIYSHDIGDYHYIIKGEKV
jgi:ubiquinone/menaquinone biosynthesis C-methylase UbiE